MTLQRDSPWRLDTASVRQSFNSTCLTEKPIKLFHSLRKTVSHLFDLYDGSRDLERQLLDLYAIRLILDSHIWRLERDLFRVIRNIRDTLSIQWPTWRFQRHTSWSFQLYDTVPVVWPTWRFHRHNYQLFSLYQILAESSDLYDNFTLSHPTYMTTSPSVIRPTRRLHP